MSSVSQFPPPHLIPDEELDHKGNLAEGANDEKGQQSNTTSSLPLSLPAPGDDTQRSGKGIDGALQVDDEDTNVRFDHLGPLVVNTNGTLSRIHNWSTLTDAERERTKRVLIKRNKARMEVIKGQESGASQEEEEVVTS